MKVTIDPNLAKNEFWYIRTSCKKNSQTLYSKIKIVKAIKSNKQIISGLQVIINEFILVITIVRPVRCPNYLMKVVPYALMQHELMTPYNILV